MGKIDKIAVRCWVDPHAENNVVTVSGVTCEEGGQILRYVGERFPNAAVRQSGEKVIWLIGSDVIMHHYHTSGGEVELLSPSPCHEQLIELLPEEIRSRAST